MFFSNMLPLISDTIVPSSLCGGIESIFCILSFEAVAEAITLLINPISITGKISITT